MAGHRTDEPLPKRAAGRWFTRLTTYKWDNRWRGYIPLRFHTHTMWRYELAVGRDRARGQVPSESDNLSHFVGPGAFNFLNRVRLNRRLGLHNAVVILARLFSRH